RDVVAASQDLLRVAGDHVRDHAPQEAGRLELDVRVGGHVVLALQLQADVHLILRDLELLDAPDVDAAHLHGVAAADAARVGYGRAHDVAPAEEGGVGQD